MDGGREQAVGPGRPRIGRVACGAAGALDGRCRATSGSGRAGERASVVNPGCTGDDDFGASVALSGTTAVIGAPGKHAACEQTLP